MYVYDLAQLFPDWVISFWIKKINIYFNLIFFLAQNGHVLYILIKLQFFCIFNVLSPQKIIRGPH